MSSTTLTSPATGFAAIYRLQLRLLVTVGRLITLGALGALAVVLGAVLGRSTYTTGTEAALDIVGDYGLILVVPIVSLVFATSALGDLREEGTLVYLWLRPLAHWVLVAASWAATVTIALPLTVVPLALAALAAGAPGRIVWAAVGATALGVCTYSAVFLALGLRAKRALMWGLLYVFIWEGFVASASESSAQLAIRAYTRSALSAGSNRVLDLAVIGPPWYVVVPLMVTVVGLGYALRRVRRQDVP